MMEDDRDLEKEKPVAESFFLFKYTPVENERNASSLKRGTVFFSKEMNHLIPTVNFQGIC